MTTEPCQRFRAAPLSFSRAIARRRIRRRVLFLELSVLALSLLVLLSAAFALSALSSVLAGIVLPDATALEARR